MNSRLGGPLGYYALVLVLLGVQWRPGFSFPTTTTTPCDGAVGRTTGVIEILKHDATNLQDVYAKFHDIDPSVRDDVPDSAISGNTISEKLQDIYVKAGLFHKHMSKVEEYQGKYSVSEKNLDDLLKKVKSRLRDVPYALEIIFTNTDPKIPQPTTPDLPELSHSDDLTKQLYGLAVIVRVKEWATEVLQLLKPEEICTVHHKGR